MHPTRSVLRWAAPAVVVIAMLSLVACSSSDDSESGSGDGSTTTVTFTARHRRRSPSRRPRARASTVPSPPRRRPTGTSRRSSSSAARPPASTPVDTPDGRPLDRDTRRRGRLPHPRHRPPSAAAADFSGTVVVEWFNVSAIEASPDWAFLSEEIGREGDAYIGVSAQAQGVEGGDTLLDVDVDELRPRPAHRASAPTRAASRTSTRSDTARSPTPATPTPTTSSPRSGGPSPSRRGAARRAASPTQVIAIGESQSAYFLSTLVNAVHPLDPVFDGFLIHSRGGERGPARRRPDATARGSNARTRWRRGRPHPHRPRRTRSSSSRPRPT